MDILGKLVEGGVLDRRSAHETMDALIEGSFGPVQVSSLLTTLAIRRPDIGEMLGFRDSLLTHCPEVSLEGGDCVDVCGTGGDGKETFNISTAAALVVAGSGARVAKHGNYGFSSSCGSSNVLEALGARFTSSREVLNQSLASAGFCYLHAPLFHPAMKIFGPVRKQLGFRTVFNLLGPLINPCRPARQTIGVSHPEAMELYAPILSEMCQDFVLLHSRDGYDEISLTADSDVETPGGRKLVSPKDLGLAPVSAGQILGGKSHEENAKILRSVLEGKSVLAQQQVVLANAGVTISMVRKVSLTDGVESARESLASGRALRSLDLFLQASR